jgi:hypothetical protein
VLIKRNTFGRRAFNIRWRAIQENERDERGHCNGYERKSALPSRHFASFTDRISA